MGMFDRVNVPPMPCPYCGKGKLTGWQSKDGQCLMDDIDYWAVNNFYTSCDKCGKWIEYQRECGPPETPLAGYKLVSEEQAFREDE